MNPLSETNVGFAHYLTSADDSGTSKFAHNGLVYRNSNRVFLLGFFKQESHISEWRTQNGFQYIVHS